MDLRVFSCICLALVLVGLSSCGDREESLSAKGRQTTVGVDPAPEAELCARLTKLRHAVDGCSIFVLDDDLALLAQVTDQERVKAVLSKIEIIKAKSGYTCRCWGEPCFAFYRSDAADVSLEDMRLRAEVRIHHGVGLSWTGWDGYSYLTESSAFSICKWLAERGNTAPLHEFEEKKRRDLALGRPW